MLGDMVNSDIESVRRTLAGDGAFERGLAYFESHKVVEFETKGTKTVARVEGSHVYTVTLHRTSRGFDGSCDCPASEGIEFCKHCVAVALTLAAKDEEMSALQTGSAQDQMRGYLLQQDKETLVVSLLEAAQNLPELHQHLSLRAAAAAGQVNLKTLKKEITAASPLRDIWYRQEVRQYFARLESVLAGINDVAENLSATDVLTLATHATNRFNKALERVDDSGGDRWSVQQLIHELNIRALSDADWDLAQQAGHLLDNVLADPYDLYAGFEQTYDDLLGGAGWSEFYLQARQRLEALPPLKFGSSFTQASAHMQLAHLLTAWHRDRGETSQEIEIRELTCTTPLDCHRIAALYLEQGDLDGCGHWLARGDAHLTEAQCTTPLHIAYHEACGNLGLALALQQRRFQDNPSYDRLEKLLRLADAADVKDETQSSALAFLHERLKGNGYGASLLAMILAQYHHGRGNRDAAYELVVTHVTNEVQLLEVADWFADRPQRTCLLIQKALEDCIANKNKRAYQRAAQLLEKVARPKFEALGEDAFGTYLASLRETHKAKRSFMAVLDAKGM